LAMPLPRTARALGLPLLLPVLLWQAPRPPPGEFDLLAADVGQGNAVLLRTAGHTLVYDAGPGYSRETDAGQRVLVPLLRAGDEQVARLVLSHRDLDHTGGAAAVLRMQPRATLLSSLEDGHPLQALRRATRCVAGQAWDWDGVRFEILHPQAADYELPARPNAMSCVLRVANASASVLLVGDIERPQEAALLEAPARLRSDLLLVPHHGSRTSSSDEFLAAVRPAAGLVQAGYRNRFGHPAADVVARYRARGIRLYLSAACGAAHWRSQQPGVVQCERTRDPHYWRPPAGGHAGRGVGHAPRRENRSGNGLELAILCTGEPRQCTNSTRCLPSCLELDRSSSRRSRWVGRRRCSRRGCATTTAPTPNGWGGSRRK
ncbi:MAG: internalization-related competence protein ComEC/Rec2, partial [Ramlibacter sp.]|nr:internalization-related competence protein ComEC/Rec2 [Ramlibacter sp.]